MTTDGKGTGAVPEKRRAGRLFWCGVAAVVIGLAAAGFWAAAVAGLPVERLLAGKHPRADKRAPWVHDPAVTDEDGQG